MKQVLMIGKFNAAFEDITAILKLRYHVQMCVDNPDMAKGLLKIDKPNAIIFCLIGLDLEGRKIMTEIQHEHSDIPVICVGSPMDRSLYREFFQKDQFCWVRLNSMDEDLLDEVSERIRIAEKNSAANNDGERKTVLVIDDNPILLRSMNSILSTHYDVMLANSGTKAMTMIGKQVPDVVFLDCEMPVCDGKMTYRMLRDLDEMKNVPIIFLTGNNEAAYIQDALKLQPAGYLLKPASRERIFETLQRVLEQ